MLGAICGDIIGSYYEVHSTKSYDFEIQKDSSFTDDTVLIMAVAKAILYNPSDINIFKMNSRAKEYGAHYRQFYSRYPGAGFGNMFSEWAKDPYASVGRSYGNGAAMRVIPIGYAYKTLSQTLLQARASCLSTHNNSEAIKGAEAVAAAIFLARQGKTKEEIKNFIEKRFKYNLGTPLSTIRETHIFDSRTSYSVPPAIVAFLESTNYESAIRNAISLGGDADTEACIAGGIAEAFYRSIPKEIEDFCQRKLDSGFKPIIKEFYNAYRLI